QPGAVPMFEKPGIAELREAATRLGMNPSDAYLEAVEECIAPLANAYAMLDAMPDELPPVRHERAAPVRPTPEDNPLGAWHVRTSIKGPPGGPLTGRRVALKDNICLAGAPLMNGAAFLSDHVSEVD